MKKAFSILLVAIMLFSTLAIGTQAQEVTTESTQDKLTDELKAHLATVEDDEYVPIYIWLNEQDEEMVYAVLSKALGMIVTKDSEEAYIERKASAKAELLSKGLENLAKTPEYSLQARATGTIDIVNLTPDAFRAQANIPEIMTNDEIKNCIESGMTSDEIINLSERTQFLSDFRMARKSLNNATNEKFYKLLDLDKCKNVYLDSLLAYVRMDCKKSYIDNLENISIVKELGLIQETTVQESSVEQVEATSYTPANITTGFDMFPQNTVDGVTYTGAGIKVGVIEAGYYDPNAYHLQGKQIEVQEDDSPIGTHATRVLSILCGEKKPYGNTFYQGIAPGVSVCFSSNGSWGPLSNIRSEAIELFLIRDACHVINMSGGINAEYGTYSAFESYIDELILQYRVVFVKSAGNEGNISGKITNPGIAYNAITVGNADSTDLENAKYKMHSSSSFLEDFDENDEEYLTNKPDIAAFGTKIKMLNDAGIPSNCFPIVNNPKTTDYVTGTSFAAPMVSGTVALMMQANPNLIGKPDVVKAILMNSADEEAIYYNDSQANLENELVSQSPTVLNSSKAYLISTILREKSGAGLLNISVAIRMAISGVYYPLVFNGSHYFISEEYYFNPATSLEFTLAYEKNTTGLIGTQGYQNDLDVQIIDSDGNVILESNDTINNVEAFKCIIANSGRYRFKIIADVNEGDDSNFYGSFIFSCDCKNKMISQSDCSNSYAHTITCSACGFSCVEPLKTVSTMITLSNGIRVYFAVTYLFERGNRDARDLMCEIIMCDYIPPSNGGIIVRDLELVNGSETETITGKIKEYFYSVTFEQNGTTQTISVSKITVVTDYFAKTVTIS